MSDQTLRNLPAFEVKERSKASLLELPNLGESQGDEQTPHAAIAALKSTFGGAPEAHGTTTAVSEPEVDPAQQADPVAPVTSPAAIDPMPLSEPKSPQQGPEPVAAEAADQAETGLPAEASKQAEPDLDPIITQFQDMIETTRTELQAQNKNMMMQCMNELLPALSREFMAEEISRHLPNLIPDKIFGVEINAAPELAEQLEQIFNRAPGLPINATIQTAPIGQKSEISLQWGDGGYDFEIEPVLQRCRQKLQASLTE